MNDFDFVSDFDSDVQSAPAQRPNNQQRRPVNNGTRPMNNGQGPQHRSVNNGNGQGQPRQMNPQGQPRPMNGGQQRPVNNGRPVQRPMNNGQGQPRPMNNGNGQRPMNNGRPVQRPVQNQVRPANNNVNTQMVQDDWQNDFDSIQSSGFNQIQNNEFNQNNGYQGNGEYIDNGGYGNAQTGRGNPNYGAKVDAKLTSILCYLSIVGWIVMYCIGDKEGAKDYMNQAFAIQIAGVVLGMVGMIGLPFPVGMIVGLLTTALGILNVVCLIAAATEKYINIPVLDQIQIIK